MSPRSLCALGALVVVAFAAAGQGLLPRPPRDQTAASTHVLIRFKSEVKAELSGQTNALQAIERQLSLPAGALQEPPVRKVLRAKRPAPAGARKNPASMPDGFLYLHLPPGLSVEECIRRFERHPWVDYIEPDGIGKGGGQVIPNDPNFGSQWHHRNSTKPSAAIHTPQAWEMTTGSTGVVVAVLDTGLATGLQEFSGRVVEGYDFVNDDTDPADDHGHGTAVTGTLAANGNNGILVAGVDWRCRIMPIKVLDQGNYGFYSDWAQGIDFAVANGAKVINLSAGGSSSSTTLMRAVTNAIAHGVIFITITHNDGTGVITYPGRLAESITVGATDPADRRTGFSNYGTEIDLVAPGTNIFTVSRTGSLQFWWGTSFAAPQVAGVCALLASLHPDLTQTEAVQLLCLGAEDRVGDSSDTDGFDSYYGWGRLNAWHSLQLANARIDQIEKFSGNSIRFSWNSPANASNKHPFEIRFSSLPGSPWSTASGPFQYSTGRTSWTDDGSQTGGFSSQRFYLLRLKK